MSSLFRISAVSSPLLLRSACDSACRTAAAIRSFHSSPLNLAKTMKVLPTQVVIAAFNDKDTAHEVAKELKKATRKGDISCQNTAVITKHKHGHVSIKEAGEIKTYQGAAVGSVLGAASVFLFAPLTVSIGALGGAVGAAAAGAEASLGAAAGASMAASATMGAGMGGFAAGGLVGGYAAHKTETMNKDNLKELGDILQPSNSAIVAVFQQVLIPVKLLDEKAADRDEVLYQVGKDLGDTLKSGTDVAYMLAVTDDGIVASKMTTGDGAADIEGLIISGDGVEAGEAIFPDDTAEYEVVDGEIMAKDDATVAK